MCLQQILQIISTGLIALTVFFLWRYTSATKKLMESSIEHNEILTKPFITAYPSELGKNLEIRNLGNGTALNVSIEDIFIRGISLDFPSYKNQTMWIELDVKQDFVPPGEPLKLGFEVSSEDEDFNEFIQHKDIRGFGFPFFKVGIEEYPLMIQYEDILNQKYVSHISVDCKFNRIKLVESKKV